MLLPSFSGAVAVQVWPPSEERSKCTRQPSWPSVLVPETMSPFASWTGLFLIGPKIPSGNRRASDQILPSSFEVLTMPHQVLGLGPTL